MRPIHGRPGPACLTVALALVAALLAPGLAGAQVPGTLTSGSNAPAASSATTDQAPPAALPRDAEIEALIRTLEEPAARDELVARLKALRSVAPAAPAPSTEPAPKEVLSAVTSQVDARVSAIVDVAQSIAASLGQLPSLVDWLGFQVTNDFRRQFWITVLQGVALMAGAGFALAALLGLAVRRPVDRLVPSPGDSLTRGVAVRVLAFALDLFPIAGFFVAANVVLRIQPLLPITVAVGTYAILAFALNRTLRKLVKHMLAPDLPARRWLPVPDGAASILGAWIKRAGRAAIFGYFLLRAGWLLGLPAGLTAVLTNLLFLAVAAMLTVPIVRHRDAIGDAIRRLAEGTRSRLLKDVLPFELLAGSGYVLLLLIVWAHYLVWAIGVEGGFRFLIIATNATIVVLLLGRLALVGLGRLKGRIAKAPQVEDGSEEPVAEMPVERGTFLFGLAGQLVKLVGLVLILQAWGVDVIGWLGSPAGGRFSEGALRIAIITGATFAVWALLNRAILRYIQARDTAGNLLHSNRSRTLANILRNILLVVVALIAIAAVLSEIGVDTAPLLAGAGVIGLAIGFGSQALVKDIITGLFILLGDTMRVGDVVNVGGRGGAVEGMSMRAVTLRDYSGAVITIPYGSIDVVTNMTKDFSFWVFNIAIDYNTDVDAAIAALKEVDEQIRREWPWRRIILQPLEVAGLDKLADSAVIIQARIKTRPGEQWRVGREMQRRIKLKFEERGIDIPFPQQTVNLSRETEELLSPLLDQLRRDTLARSERERRRAARPARLAATGT